MARVTSIVIAVVIVLWVRHAAELGLENLDHLRAGIRMSASPGWVAFFAAHRLASVVIGLGAALALGSAIATGRGRRALRVLGAVACAGSLVELVVAVFDHSAPETLAGFVATAGAGAWLAFGRAPVGRTTWLVVPAAVVAVLAVARPVVAQIAAGHSGVHRPFTIE